MDGSRKVTQMGIIGINAHNNYTNFDFDIFCLRNELLYKPMNKHIQIFDKKSKESRLNGCESRSSPVQDLVEKWGKSGPGRIRTCDQAIMSWAQNCLSRIYGG